METIRQHFVSLTGQRLKIDKVHEGKIPNRSATGQYYEVTDVSGSTIRVCVGTGVLTEVWHDHQHKGNSSFEQVKERAALFSILDGFDARAEELADPRPVKLIMLDSEALQSARQRTKVADRDIRRYITRRVYDEYSRSTLTEPVVFDELDHSYTGATHRDFVRCAQVLCGEGYLTMKVTMPSTGPAVVPMSKLVRDVERYGAAREDVGTDEDYGAAVAAWPALKPHAQALLAERARYVAASSQGELLSVFRAVAPIIESIARNLLANRGSDRDYPTLGPIIADLQSRGIAGRAIIAQLDHVLKFSRDLAQHGEDIPLAVLRISCENAFALAPQLAALFRSGDISSA